MFQPKYWCKNCKTFVRDTKLEKANHEASPKHQGNIKRFLRDLHRSHERDEREKQRAKDEVNRLNGVVSGSSAGLGQEAQGSGAPWRRKPAVPPPTANGPRQATPAERRQQLAQLAEMGIAVPEEFRRDMAMAGDWQVISEKPVYDPVNEKEEAADDVEDVKPAGLNIGVRKRRHEGPEEEEDDGEIQARGAWGSKFHTYPDPRGQDGQEDLDLLLGKTGVNKLTGGGTTKHNSGDESIPVPPSVGAAQTIKQDPDAPPIEQDIGETKPSSSRNIVIKPDSDFPEQVGIVFKKRKLKPIRNK